MSEQGALDELSPDKENKETITSSEDSSKDKTQAKKELSPEEKQARKKKLIKTSVIAAIIIALAIGAFFLAPTTMKPNTTYDVTLNIDVFSNNYTVNFSIEMQEAADSTKIEQIFSLGSSGNNCIIFTNTAYETSTNSKVEFYVGLLDSSNNSIKNLGYSYSTGVIYNEAESFNRKVRPAANTSLTSELLSKEVVVAKYTMTVPFKTGIAMTLLVLVAGLWITEIFPTAVGSFLVPIIVSIAGISTAGEALQPFFDPVIALFLGGFIIAEALKKHNIDRRFALAIAGNASARPSMLLLILMAFSAFLSMWMSNTASAAVMIPIAIALVDQIQKSGKEKDVTGFKKALVLGIGYAATTGGIASVIGTPANPIAVKGLKNVGIEISFLKWILIGLPFVIIMLLIVWGYLLLTFRPKVSKESLSNARVVFKKDLKKMGKMGTKEWITLGIFTTTILLWLFASPLKNWTGGAVSLSSGIIALVAVVLIFGTNTLEPKDVKKINWNALFLFGGGLTLGNALVSTGIGDWIASNMGIIEGKHYILIAFIVGGISLLVTAVASNTASAAMLVPLVIPIAFSVGANPVLLAVVAAIGSSIDYALVFGTPPTMISYSTGYFSVKEIFRIGSILDVIGIILLSTVSAFIWVSTGLMNF